MCIIGAGAAGITVGLELVNSGLSVGLVESGGFDHSPATQALYRGTSSAGLQDYFDLARTRLRMFGGTTNHWRGWCRPLSPADFRIHAWIPESGWPIQHTDLAPHYRRAQELCELGPFRYDGSSWLLDGESLPQLGSHTELIHPAVYQFSSPTRFGRRYREPLEAATNVEIILHSNAVGFSTPTEGGRVDATKFATLGGNEFAVRARAHVLATGGIENARLLLATDVIPRASTGRARELIGRYFMDHLHVEAGIWLPDTRYRLSSFFERRTVRGQEVMGALSAPVHVRNQHDMLGFSAELQGPLELGEVTDLRYSEARQSLRRLGNTLAGRGSDGFGADDLWTIFTSPLDAMHTMWRGLSADPVRGYRLYCRCEQRPNPYSRIELERERDELGMPRVVLHWELTAEDFASIQKGVQLVAREVGALGAGRIRQAPVDFLRDRVVGGHHHLGTTRMASTPTRGVVDANCRAFGTDNLYVAGSSVFPTAGFANPTLTIVALSARLAGYLSHRLRRQ